jgi:hypothetical protein
LADAYAGAEIGSDVSVALIAYLVRTPRAADFTPGEAESWNESCNAAALLLAAAMPSPAAQTNESGRQRQDRRHDCAAFPTAPADWRPFDQDETMKQCRCTTTAQGDRRRGAREARMNIRPTTN